MQKSSKFLLEILTLVSSANSMGMASSALSGGSGIMFQMFLIGADESYQQFMEASHLLPQETSRT
jgi:hypothetical protein